MEKTNCLRTLPHLEALGMLSIVVLMVGAAACDGARPIQGDCPCGPGWECCEDGDTCVRAGSLCPAADPADGFRIVSPVDGEEVFVADGELAVRYQVPEGTRVTLPGLCGDDPRCGHMALRINGDACNRPGDGYNHRDATNPILGYPGMCPELPEESILSLAILNDQGLALRDDDGNPMTDEVTVRVTYPAVGPAGIVYLGSPDGTALVPGAAPIRHEFLLTNYSSSTLSFSVFPDFPLSFGTSGHYEARVFDPEGTERQGFTLASGSEERLWVKVGADGEAPLGDLVWLRVSAPSPPPGTRHNEQIVYLEVADQANPAKTTWLSMHERIAEDASDMSPGGWSGFNVRRELYSLQHPTRETLLVDFWVEVMPPDRWAEWRFAWSSGTSEAIAPGELRTYEVPVDSLAEAEVRVDVVAPPERGPEDTFATVHLAWRAASLPLDADANTVVFRLGAESEP
jgi:hypothetical protein